jgi:hypothetical protein
VNGTDVGGLDVVDNFTGASDSIGAVRAIPGSPPIIAYDINNDAGGQARAASIGGSPQTLADVVGADAGIDDIEGMRLPGGGAAVAWLTDDGDTVAGAYAVVSAGAAPACAVAVPSFIAVSLANRPAAPQLVGLTAGGQVGLVNIAANCPAAVAQLSAPVPDGLELSTGVDADGTLLALVGRGDDNATRVMVDDITPPAVGPIGVASQVAAGAPVPGSVFPFDPWGVADIAWSIDGQEVAHGAAVTLPGRPAGQHVVAVRVRNTAGLDATAQKTITASATAPQPTPTPSPAPAQDTTPPMISHLVISRRCVRAGTRARLLAGFDLSENAQMVFSIRRRVQSRARSRCPRPGGHTPGTVVPVGSRQRPGSAGHNVATIARRDRTPSRAGRGRRGHDQAHLAQLVAHLRPGTYQLVVRATDAGGNRSADSKVKFWVLIASRAR